MAACHLSHTDAAATVCTGRPTRKGDDTTAWAAGLPKSAPPGRYMVTDAVRNLDRPAGRLDAACMGGGSPEASAACTISSARGPGGSCPHTIPGSRKVHGRAGQHHACSGSSSRQYSPPTPPPSAAYASRSLYCRGRGYMRPKNVMAWTTHSFSRITARRARRIGCAAQITAHTRPDSRSENNPKNNIWQRTCYILFNTRMLFGLIMICMGRCVHVIWTLSYDGHIRTCR